MKALALVESPDHVCCRYRLRAFLPVLEQAGHSIEFQGLARGLRARLGQLRRATQFDCVILQRRLLPRPLLYGLRRYARRLIFDFDDAVLYRDSYHAKGFEDPKRLARFATAVRWADRVLAGNDFLRSCALAAGARPERVQVFPTCVPTEAYPVRSEHEPAHRSGMDLVWIGSSSTLQGLEQRAELWRRVGREVPGVRLRLICDRFATFDPLPVVPIVWSEAGEIENLSTADVGVSWIPDDPWSRGKCGLKLLQYQAAGLPTVANPVGVHPTMIEPGVSGELCQTDDDWVAAITRLAQSPTLRRQMGRQARRCVETRYSVAAWSDAFVEAVTGMAPTDPGTTRPTLDPVCARTRVQRSTPQGIR